MARNTKVWSDEENKELLSFIEKYQKQGYLISRACERYCQLHPELTAMQVRSHYYQLLADNSEKKFVSKPWNEEEDKKLLDDVNNKGSKSLTQVFNELSSVFDRSPRTIATHYYSLIKKINSSNPKNEINDIDDVVIEYVNNIGLLEETKVEKFLKALENSELLNEYLNNNKDVTKLSYEVNKLKKSNEKFKKLNKELTTTIIELEEKNSILVEKFKNLSKDN